MKIILQLIGCKLIWIAGATGRRTFFVTSQPIVGVMHNQLHYPHNTWIKTLEFKIWCDPTAPMSRFVSLPLFRWFIFPSINSFKLPLRDSFPVSHVHSQPCPQSAMSTVSHVPGPSSTTVSCIPFTASQTTDSIPVHSLLLRCVQLFNRFTIQWFTG